MRSIAAVVLGYLVMALWVMITLSLAWLAVGPSFAFKEGSTDVTAGWIALNLPLSLIGAILGGWVTALVARGARRPVQVFAGIVLVLGLAMAVGHLLVDQEPAEPVAVAEMGTFEAASEARQPTWYNFILPFIGCAGVLIGGRLKRPSGLA